jgi:hypothetical protein
LILLLSNAKTRAGKASVATQHSVARTGHALTSALSVHVRHARGRRAMFMVALKVGRGESPIRQYAVRQQAAAAEVST